MDRELSAATLESFLARVGERITYPVRINLLGGSGLILLGHHRPTVDIEVLKSMLENAILQAKVFDLDPSRMRRHLKLVRKTLTER